MKIGIDCRIFGSKHTGIGRYVQNLVEELLKIDSGNEYVLFIQKDFLTQISNFNPFDRLRIDAEQSRSIKTQNQNSKLKTVIVDVPHYSLKEQFLFSSIINREKVDIMHFPHFNVPVFYGGKYVVTIHDLIKHSSKGKETTTKSSWLYWLKYLGYRFVFKQAVERAEKIIVPSQFVKGEVVKECGVDPNKITVTYEGVDTNLKSQISNLKTTSQNSKLLEQYKIKKPYLLYVGSVYPHKNIERLIEVVKIVNVSLTPKSLPPITLIIVCARNVFIERLSKLVVQNGAASYVNLTGFVPDEDLAVLYKEASAFVFPTLSEGFGLPGLEAMALKCPVVCSDIPVLREIYKDAAVYFNPLDPSDMAEKIKSVMNEKDKRNQLIKEGQELVKEYSWQKTAKETLSVYNAD